VVKLNTNSHNRTYTIQKRSPKSQVAIILLHTDKWANESRQHWNGAELHIKLKGERNSLML